MRYLIGISLMLGVMLATVSSVQAASGSGYVCRVTLASNVQPQGPIFVIMPTPGDHGKIYFQMYSQPFCGGSFVRSFQVHSDGSNVNNYISGSTVYPTHSEAQIMGLLAALQTAANDGEPVYVSGPDWNVLGGTSGTHVTTVRFANY